MVTCAGSGNHALRLLESRPVDVVVSDMSMRDGDGLSLLASLRRRGDDVPVIFVTAGDENRSRYLRQGAFAVLGKPCDFELLERKIALACPRLKP